jgi:hypothetical protein
MNETVRRESTVGNFVMSTVIGACCDRNLRGNGRADLRRSAVALEAEFIEQPLVVTPFGFHLDV